MRLRVLLGALVSTSALSGAFAPVALADGVHYDIGVGVGPSKRFLGNKPEGGDDSAFGGVAMVHADVALAPLVRIGVYAGFEVSPPPNGDVREMFPFGFQVKVAPPIDSDRFKVYGFLGFGYNAVYTHSYTETIPLQNAQGALVNTPARLEGVSGSYFELPFGVGATYQLRNPGSSSPSCVAPRASASALLCTTSRTPAVAPGRRSTERRLHRYRQRW